MPDLEYYKTHPYAINCLVFEDIIKADGVYFKKIDNISGICETFGRRDYEFGLNDDYVFIDVGTNLAESALFLASQEHCKKVYAYEPFPETFEIAKENLLLNPQLKDKIQLFNFAWGNENAEIEAEYSTDTNVSAINSLNKDFQQKMKIYPNKKANIKIKKSSDELKEIITQNKQFKIVLKLDIEGDEWKCLSDIASENLLEKLDIIIFEWHFKDINPYTNLLEQNHFIWFNERFTADTGLIRAIKI